MAKTIPSNYTKHCHGACVTLNPDNNIPTSNRLCCLFVSSFPFDLYIEVLMEIIYMPSSVCLIYPAFT